MFQKIINGLKNFFAGLSQEEKRQLLVPVGLVVLGFGLFFFWKVRLPNGGPEIEPPPEEEPIDENGEEDIIESELNYEIVGLTDRIQERQQVELFGLRESPEFAIEFEGVIHSGYENPDRMSLEDWVDDQIRRKAPVEEGTLSERESALGVLSRGERDTPLGEGIEITRLNDGQAEDLFLTMNGAILHFHYQAESAARISNLRRKREELLESIQ